MHQHIDSISEDIHRPFLLIAEFSVAFLILFGDGINSPHLEPLPDCLLIEFNKDSLSIYYRSREPFFSLSFADGNNVGLIISICIRIRGIYSGKANQETDPPLL